MALLVCEACMYVLGLKMVVLPTSVRHSLMRQCVSDKCLYLVSLYVGSSLWQGGPGQDCINLLMRTLTYFGQMYAYRSCLELLIPLAVL
jgi:hypothetical protein